MRPLWIVLLLLLAPALARAQDAGVSNAASPDASYDAGRVTDAAVPPDGAAPETPPPGVDPPVVAGPPEAPPEAAQPPPATSTDVFSVLSELIFERTERAEADARQAAREARRANERLERRERDERADPVEPSADADEAVLVRLVDDTGGIAGWSLPDPRIKTGGLVFLILLSLLVIWILQRLRRPLPDRGLLPRSLGFLHVATRITVVVMSIMLVSRLLPEWLRPALLLAMGAIALTVGAGAVVIMLPDMVGGLLLITEGRIKAGLWIEGDGFRGTVVRVGPRLTVLRVPDGTLLTIPNRRLVKSPIHAADRRWHQVETELEVSALAGSAEVRRAIEETVLCSPFVPVEPALEVTRDPGEPCRWMIKARLLHAGFEDRFRGQLLERVDDALRAGSDGPVEPSETDPA